MEGSAAPGFGEGHAGVEPCLSEGAAEGAEVLACRGQQEALQIFDGSEECGGGRGEAQEGPPSGELQQCHDAGWGTFRSV